MTEDKELQSIGMAVGEEPGAPGSHQVMTMMAVKSSSHMAMGQY